MPDTTVKLQDITPVKSTFDNDDQLLLINPTGEARISKEDFLDAMPDDAITLIGDLTTTGIEGDTVAKQLGALENSKAPVITDTASGAIANFPDGADDIPVADLVVNIEPKQSGSGDPSPSNIRPITGWTGANVTRTGKNLLPQMVDGTYTGNGVTAVVANGIATFSGTTTASGNALIIPLSATFTVPSITTYIHLGNSAVNGSVAPSFELSTDAANTSVSVSLNPANRIYEIPSAKHGVTWDRVRFYLGSGVTLSGTFAPMVCYGSSATTYEPYQGTTLAIDWTTEAGTVYGGTIDVATGLLTVDRAIVDLGTLTWAASETGSGRYYAAVNGIKLANPRTLEIICSCFKPNVGGGAFENCSIYNVDFRLYAVNNNFIDDASGFTESVTEQVAVYPLATPQTYQLTPQQLMTLLGTNNVWADTGDVTVTYPADTKMFIEKLTMPTEDDLVANQAITSGKYFMVGNSLYLALANIASGAQITIGTNAQRVSLADALNTINS